MKTIMTVDDSPSVRQIARFVLRSSGYEVIEAVDGPDALSRLNGQELHLILTDLNMPNMDGLALIRRIRAMPQYKFVPIVVMSGDETLKQAQREIKAAGATGWIDKPFEKGQLLTLIKQVLRRCG